MRVAITHPYSWPEVRRGAERIIVETARALAGRGHDVTILTAGSDAGRRRDGGVTTIKLRRIFKDPVRHERWFGWRLLPVLARGRFDVTHSFMPPDAVAAIRTKRVAGHRTLYDEMGIPIRQWWAGQPHAKARQRVARDVDVYGCMSRFALDALERTCDRSGVLIPGGVRMSEFRPAAQREPHPTVLFSGALGEPRKGVGLLLEALALIAQGEPDVQLWLSGPGDPRDTLAAAPPDARARTTVLPVGDPRDQGERYGRAWVTALPSEHDSFGMVLLESLACGTPIAVLDHAAPPELVTPETGAIAAPGNPAALADGLDRALALARERATVGRCRAVAARYDWDNAIAPHLEALYAGEPVVVPASLL